MKKIISLIICAILIAGLISIPAPAAEISDENTRVRIEENFNRDWLFSYGEHDGAQNADYDDSAWTPVGLPHSFSIPYDLNQDSFYVGVGWYRKTFDIPNDWADKFISLDFEGVFQKAAIYVNGVYVPVSKVYGYEEREDNGFTHEGGYSGFSVDITDFVTPGSENLVAIKVDNTWSPDLTPRGGDHQFSGGIYRDVTLSAVNKLHVDWYGTFVWTPAICNPAYQKSENRPDDAYESDFVRNGTGITNTLDDPNVEGSYVTEAELLENIKNRTSDVEIQTEITNTAKTRNEIYLIHKIKDSSGKTVTEFKSEKVKFDAGERKTVTARSSMISDIALWDFENPNLYTALTRIYSSDGTLIDDFESEFGFRSAQFKLDGFYLNGKKTLLDGANVHQDHGGWADATTNMGFMRDVKYVKEAGFNFIRGSHYPHDPAFAKACDELGVGFWSEGGLWSIGGYNEGDSVSGTKADWLRSAYPTQEEYKEAFEQSCFDLVGSMVRINRNHPSIIVWSMGNEAFFSNGAVMDDVRRLISDLRDYAHKLDYTRKAGLGGTQRQSLNTLAVCDVAGGNGDGATAAYTNFYLPHIVAEYSSGKNDRPGAGDFQYGEITNRSDPTKYVLPSRTITFKDGTTALSSSSGLSIWCMYHHGSVGGRNLRIMGLMDYYRLPTTRYYLYRNDRTGKEMPPKSKTGTAKRINLTVSTDITLDDKPAGISATVPNDGTGDAQIILTLVDENGNWVNDTRDAVIEVVDGNGVFPTGKSYDFIAGQTIQDGKASIEFRSYYSGETTIRAYIPGTSIVSNTITVTTENVGNIIEGTESENFIKADNIYSKKKLPEPETYGKIDFAYNRQSRASSYDENHIPLNAIDGDKSTYWQAAKSGNGEYWKVFLENTYYVERVKVDMGENPSAYSIYYTDDIDRDHWVKVADCTGNEPEVDFGGVYTGGIKIEFTGVGENEYAKLYSLNVYGTTFTGYARESAYLSDFTAAKEITQGWEGKSVVPNKSIEENAITLAGEEYEKGLGLHADSEAVYDLDGNYSRFTSVIGIDDEVGSYGNDGAYFRIYATVGTPSGDAETLIYEQFVGDAGKAYNIDVSVEGAKRLRLVTDKVKSNSKDHTDWANPVLWGATRDISTGAGFTVLASGGDDIFVRISANGAESGRYNIKTIYLDKNGNEISSKSSGFSSDGGNTLCIVRGSAPKEKEYVKIEVSDINGNVIGSGIVNARMNGIEKEENCVYLSDLAADTLTQGWEGKTPGLDVSIEGNPIRVGGRVYKKGLGLHANSEAVYTLDDTYTLFHAVLGIDSECDGHIADTVYRVYATIDGTEKMIYEKNIVSGMVETVDLDIFGAEKLRLVTDANGVNSNDHTDWADAKLLKEPVLTVENKTVTAVNAPKGSSMIAAFYKGGALSELRLLKSADRPFKFTFENPIESGGKMKAFLWDMDTCLPLALPVLWFSD